jgi:hypothetical protein
MLANIESRLEECVFTHLCITVFLFIFVTYRGRRYISLVESLPAAFVEEAEKTKEKERRQVDAVEYIV